MKNYNNKKGFTIAELVIALILVSFIAMLLMPIVFNDSKKHVLMAALNKNYTNLLEIHKTIPMLQARGKIAPGSITVEKFMEATVLTQNAIGINSNGFALADANNKFTQYIAGYTTTPANLLNSYTQFSLTNTANTTIIFKNGVYISQYTSGGTDYIMVDINGRKTPNRTGEDIFFFEIINSNAGNELSNSILQPVDDNNCEVGGTFSDSKGCAKQYIEAGSMD